jgi:NADH-quinone oxidoreductase subunit C
MIDGLSEFPDLSAIHDALAAHFGSAVLESTFAKKELSVRIRAENLLPVVSFLKSVQGFNALSDMIGLDHPGAPAEGRTRFSVLYQLYKFPAHLRIRLVVDVAEGGEVASIVSVHPSADWAEREIFDMFGIRFAGHPDLRRVYLDAEFEGHPLRKDFPLQGKP